MECYEVVDDSHILVLTVQVLGSNHDCILFSCIPFGGLFLHEGYLFEVLREADVLLILLGESNGDEPPEFTVRTREPNFVMVFVLRLSKVRVPAAVTCVRPDVSKSSFR